MSPSTVQGTSPAHGVTTRRGFSTTKLRARLSANEAPEVASLRGYLRNNMPAIYQDGDFGLRFLGALETTLDPIVGTLDVLSRYFHPTLAPRDVLDLLASWLGLNVEEGWPDERLREALSREGELSRQRGTKAGLTLALSIAFPRVPLRVEDGGGVTWSTNPDTRTESSPAELCGLLRHSDPRKDPARDRAGDRGDKTGACDLQTARQSSEETAAAAR